MRNKRVKVGIFLVCSVILLSMLYSGTEGSTEETGSGVEAEDLKESETEMEIRAGDETYPVHAWKNENDGNYYFFLPEYLKNEIRQNTFEGKEAENIRTVNLSDIPIVYIETETGAFDAVKESKENREKINIAFFDKEEGLVDRGVSGTIKARGNASFYAPRYKKSYTVKLVENKEILGMPCGDEWVLLAHYYDDTHLRDYMTFDMAEQLEMDYVPHRKLVNLYVDGNFEGIYFLCEKIGIAPQKLNLTNLEQITLERMPKDVLKKYPYAREGVRGGQNVIIEKGFVAHEGLVDNTGGYLLELEWMKDRYNEEKSGFTSDGNQCVVIKSPEYATSDQVSYIKNYYQQFEDALKRSIEEHSEEYLEYIDLDSFVKKYLVEEVSKNMDANLSSQYLYKNSDAVDSKFYAGPVWDYDRAYDNKVGDVNNRGTDLFWVNQGRAGFDFWMNLYETEVFSEQAQKIYKEKISSALTEYAENTLWEWEAEIHDSIIADMFRYQNEYEVKMDEEERLSTEMQALVEFIKGRKAFLDKEWITN